MRIDGQQVLVVSLKALLVLVCYAALGADVETPEKPRGVSIEVCEIPIRNGRVCFQETLLLKARSDETGQLSDVWFAKDVRIADKALDLEALQSCIRRWRLLPSETYVIRVACGTTGETLSQWTIIVQGGSMTPVTLVVPR